MEGKSRQMVAIKCGQRHAVSFREIKNQRKPADLSYLKLLERLSI
jgi:hypothetical protein